MYIYVYICIKYVYKSFSTMVGKALRKSTQKNKNRVEEIGKHKLN